MTDRSMAPDTALEFLVTLANKQTEPSPEGGFGVTLFVGGAVVSGRIVPNWQWMELVAETVQTAYMRHNGDADDSDARKGETVWFDHLAARMKENRDAEKALREVADRLTDEQVRGASEPYSTAFIHLVGAQSFQSGQFVPEAGSYWRGRLSEVDGWFPGSLG